MKQNFSYLVIILLLVTSCIKKSTISDSELEIAKRSVLIINMLPPMSISTCITQMIILNCIWSNCLMI